MPTRPPTSLVMLVLLLGAGAMMAAAVTSWQMGHGVDAGRSLMLGCCGLLAGIGGFRVGRLMASGQLFTSRVCRSCNARRRTTAAFCESCHRRD